MRLVFIGADHEVTGSCHYMEAAGKHMLVDCGMEQGVNSFENAKLPVPEAMLDYVFLTHAHVDHSGMLPALYAKGFRGQIFATQATAQLCDIMLRDCAHIQQQEAEWKSRKAKRHAGMEVEEPPYTMEDAVGTINLIVPCEYGKEIQVSDDVRIRFTDIGHLLGSSSIEIWLRENGIQRKLCFSGDIGNKNQPLIRDPQPTADADYVIMESTYGDRYHEGGRPDFAADFAAVIQDTFDKGGNVVIPSFAVGRTQEVLYFLRKIKEENMVTGHGNFPVYVDSPLAVEATEIFEHNIYECFDEAAMELVREGINPISFPGLHLSITSDESKAINFDETPKVIVSASGMCEAGRIRHHLKHNLWRPECTILFVGYQSAGTLGRKLLERIEEVKLFGETVDVRASIVAFKGLSGHADKNGLIEWLSCFRQKPRRVFIVHGEDAVCTSFAGCLKEEYGYETYAPYSGTSFDLINNAFEHEAAPVYREKAARVAANSVYARLEAAGARLLAVIRGAKGMANKDLARFADQINALCDKWK